MRKNTHEVKQMRLTPISIAANLLLASLSLGCADAQNVANETTKTLYFLKDDSHMQWCGYATEARLKDQVQSLMAMVIGGAEFANGRLSTVKITEADETGDWAVNDEYTVGADGKIRSLRRTINIIPEDNSGEQRFVVKDGRAIKQSDIHHELRTGKPTQNSVDWFKAPPVTTEVTSFPFFTLITSKKHVVWSTGEVCVPERAK